MRRIWFELYPRKGGSRVMDSCGFEHVFVGEFGAAARGEGGGVSAGLVQLLARHARETSRASIVGEFGIGTEFI